MAGCAGGGEADGEPLGGADRAPGAHSPLPQVGWAAGGGRKLPAPLAVACGKGPPVTSCPALAPVLAEEKEVSSGCSVGWLGDCALPLFPGLLRLAPYGRSWDGVGRCGPPDLPLSLGCVFFVQPRHWTPLGLPLPFTSWETEAGRSHQNQPPGLRSPQGLACPLLPSAGLPGNGPPHPAQTRPPSVQPLGSGRHQTTSAEFTGPQTPCAEVRLTLSYREKNEPLTEGAASVSPSSGLPRLQGAVLSLGPFPSSLGPGSCSPGRAQPGQSCHLVTKRLIHKERRKL